MTLEGGNVSRKAATMWIFLHLLLPYSGLSFASAAVRVSAPVLLSNADEFNAESIEVFGYLALDNGALILLPTAGSVDVGDTRLSILINGDHQILQESCNRYCYSYVSVEGEFSAPIYKAPMRDRRPRGGSILAKRIAPVVPLAIDTRDRDVADRDRD